MICKFCEREHDVDELCKISRRSFFFLGLGALAAVAVSGIDLVDEGFKGLEYDYTYFDESSIIAIELEKMVKKIPTLFERDDIFYSSIKKRSIEVISERMIRVPLQLDGRYKL